MSYFAPIINRHLFRLYIWFSKKEQAKREAILAQHSKRTEN